MIKTVDKKRIPGSIKAKVQASCTKHVAGFFWQARAYLHHIVPGSSKISANHIVKAPVAFMAYEEEDAWNPRRGFSTRATFLLTLLPGTLTLRPPTNRPCDIPTHTIRPPNILSTVTIFYCDTSTMWHFSTVTFRLCDNFLLRHFDYVTFCYCDIPTLTIFYCDTSTMWHFSTVTFWLCDNFLLWHSVSKWTDCPSTPKSGRFVTLWHSDPL